MTTRFAGLYRSRPAKVRTATKPDTAVVTDLPSAGIHPDDNPSNNLAMTGPVEHGCGLFHSRLKPARVYNRSYSATGLSSMGKITQ